MRRDIETRFKPKVDSYSTVPVSVMLDKPTDILVRSLPNRSEWLRRVISEAAQRELMGDTSEAAKRKRDDQSFADEPTSKSKKRGDVDAK